MLASLGEAVTSAVCARSTKSAAWMYWGVERRPQVRHGRHDDEEADHERCDDMCRAGRLGLKSASDQGCQGTAIQPQNERCHQCDEDGNHQ